MPRPTVAEISRSALEHNWRQIQARVGATPICAIVKADAYGHGAENIAAELARLGCHCWGVHSMAEALELRAARIEGTVLILGGVYPDEISQVIKHKLTPAVYDEANLAALVRAFTREQVATPSPVHLKLDTGMGRLGVRPESLESFLKAFAAQKVMALTGVFAHLPLSEDREKTLEQKRVLDGCLTKIRAAGFSPGLVHHSNSLVSMRYADLRYDLVRPGVILYGIVSHESMAKEYPLKPVMRFVTRVISVRDIPAGEGLSYGHTFVTKRASRIATIPVGYADGYPRSCSNKGQVLVRGKRAPIVGRVCMDMSLIDVTELPQVEVGDRVLLFGQEPDGSGVPVEEVARTFDSIAYEVLVGISPRVPRIWVE